ncbi:MAG TPA: amidase [Jiangellaceae bacterium]|nr:amidase [Jiangellaceae bacterium]
MLRPSARGQRLVVSDRPPYDGLQAFVRDNHVALRGAETGALSGLTFAAKDVFDVKGSSVGNGHPDYLSAQSVSQSTASILTRLLEAGADLVGKTVCDEICYSISGENWNYGSPVNPHDPWRYAGGSSSGSAAATAGGLVDFALGSDCLGSVRVPASYTGLIGMRPTYDRVPSDGEAPYCPSMDVVGFMADEPSVFERLARVMLDEDDSDSGVTTVYRAEDCFDCVDVAVRDALDPAVQRVGRSVENRKDVVVAPEGLDRWMESFRLIQGYEVWRSYRSWIEQVQPKLSPGPRERLAAASNISTEDYEQARLHREDIREQLDSILTLGSVLVLPTTASIAPLRSASPDEIGATRLQSTYLLCISPLTGTPQVTVPLTSHQNMPLGLTLVGARGTDLQLARFASALVHSLRADQPG